MPVIRNQVPKKKSPARAGGAPGVTRPTALRPSRFERERGLKPGVLAELAILEHCLVVNIEAMRSCLIRCDGIKQRLGNLVASNQPKPKQPA